MSIPPELRERYENTLRLRGRSPRTVAAYTLAVDVFARGLSPRPLDAAVPDDIVNHLRSQATRGLSTSTVRVSHYALRFLYREVYEPPRPYPNVPPPRRCFRLPEAPSADDVQRFLAAAPGLKYRTFFLVCFSCGLRTQEALNVRLADIKGTLDAQGRPLPEPPRCRIHVVLGKGGKDRLVKLHLPVLHALRECWRTYRPHTYLFEGRIPGRPLSASAVQSVARETCRRAGISQHIHPRALRHAFATWMLDHGANIRRVQEALGHRSLATTGIYTHLTDSSIDTLPCPLR